MTLPAFSGDQAVCTKCGHKGASATFRPLGNCDHERGQIIDTWEGIPNPRLCRECTKCGHSWDEATQDAKEAT